MDSKTSKIKWLLITVAGIFLAITFELYVTNRHVNRQFAEVVAAKDHQIQVQSDSIVQLYKLIAATEKTIQIQTQHEKAIEIKYHALADSAVIRQFTAIHPGSRLVRILRTDTHQRNTSY